MEVSAQSGPARVVGRGTVTTFWGHPLRLAVALDGTEVAVHLRFRSDPDLEDVSVESGWGDRGLELDLVNFDRDDGRGSAEPVLVAELGEDLVFFHFRVFRYGRTPDHTVHYTFYRVAKAAVGWQPGAGGG